MHAKTQYREGEAVFFFLKLKQQIHTKLVVQMQDCNVYVLIYKMAVAQTFCHGAAI